jgi:hypothetical protein
MTLSRPVGHRGLIDLLEAAAPEFPRGGMSRQEYHRAFGAKGGIERAHGIGVARPPGHHRDPWLARQSAPGVGHVDGSRLVPGMDQLELVVERRIEERHDVIAREREDGAAAEAIQAFGDDVGTPELGFHGNSSVERACSSTGAQDGGDRRPRKEESGVAIPLRNLERTSGRRRLLVI